VWGYALLINGLCCVFMVVRYGGEKFRKEVVNKVRLDTYRMICTYIFGREIFCSTQSLPKV